MKNVLFQTDLFSGQSPKRDRTALQLYLDLLYRLDLDYLRAYPDTPHIYDAGVRYKREPLNGRERPEKWKTVPRVIQDGHGDCEDLGAWLAAQVTLDTGRKARVFFTEQEIPSGGTLFHIKVRLPNGRIEDPSARLGMR